MTIFTTTSYPVRALIDDIDLGKVGLPDLQRPFVWRNVRSGSFRLGTQAANILKAELKRRDVTAIATYSSGNFMTAIHTALPPFHCA